MWNSIAHHHQQILQTNQPMTNFAPTDYCSYCNVPISTRETEQWNHLMLCHKELVTAMTCNKCKKQFPNPSEVLAHLLFTWNRAKCPMCRLIVPSHPEMMQHIQQKHKGYFGRHINSKLSRPFNHGSQSTIVHLGNGNGSGKFHICELCSTVNTVRALHYKHMRQTHPQYVSENWHNCLNCSASFSDMKNLNNHRYSCVSLTPKLGDLDLDSIDFQLAWLPKRYKPPQLFPVNNVIPNPDPFFSLPR